LGSEIISKIQGRWDRVVTATDKRTKRVDVVFDIADIKKTFNPSLVLPEPQQYYFESRRVWSAVSQALRAQDIDLATEEKLRLEDGQRAGKKEREESGRVWSPRLFENMNPSDPKSLSWRFKHTRTDVYQGPGEDEGRWEADLIDLVSHGELAVGRELMARLNP